ncbi:hypothetical protein [Rhodoferax fermentans]|nr:hypothetical protein [Rhodoferax fermentans]
MATAHLYKGALCKIAFIRHLRYQNNGEGRQNLQAEVAQRLRTLTGRD